MANKGMTDRVLQLVWKVRSTSKINRRCHFTLIMEANTSAVHLENKQLKFSYTEDERKQGNWFGNCCYHLKLNECLWYDL